MSNLNPPSFQFCDDPVFATFKDTALALALVSTFVNFQSNTVSDGNNIYRIAMSQHYNGNYTGFKNPRFTEIRVKELDNESDMEKDLGKYVVDTTALMQDLRKLKTIERVS